MIRLMKYLQEANSPIKNRFEDTRDWKVGKMNYCLLVMEFAWSNEKFCKIDNGDGYKTLNTANVTELYTQTWLS